MSEKFKMVGNTKVLQGTRAYELLESKDPADQKKAQRLVKFADLCYRAGYDYAEVQRLRKEFNDVV